jgi:dTDP-L-rhamnose 4-epimerase
MSDRILVTGGAGFIGSHLVDHLVSHGFEVRVLDNLDPQVHGDTVMPPSYLSPEAEFMYGDVRDIERVRDAVRGIDAVVHLAAAVGVGQSMYEIRKYAETNTVGTATLLEALMTHPVARLVVASSMSIYGEGRYCRAPGGIHDDVARTLEQLQRGEWDVVDDAGSVLTPLATPETKHPMLSSVYALSKYDQERMCLMFGRAYHVPTVALRFFNVYGSRQALSNPYTGVLAIFATRYLNDKPPLIFEDGNQMRDFVSVYDIAEACGLALVSSSADCDVFNIGSGKTVTIRQVADDLGRALGREHIKPVVTGRYRVGDIRHCFADIQRARGVLGYRPRIPLDDGLRELVVWLGEQRAIDNVEAATTQLVARGLTL